ncbi:MAG TPA: hypothetical protein VMT85_25060 [Thermoanaerobaculia bacterium]|nr:hypothetical protein [Thermoanaerobaculia bacterium]
MDPHRRAEIRSLALHAEVVRRLRERPALIDEARRRLERWAASGAVAAPYVEAWTEALEQAPEELYAQLVADDEEARALRQCSPFAGVLTPTERWAIWRRAGEETA